MARARVEQEPRSARDCAHYPPEERALLLLARGRAGGRVDGAELRRRRRRRAVARGRRAVARDEQRHRQLARERLRARKLERERDDAVQRHSSTPLTTDDLSLEDLQERIHGLTLAYYYMKRKQPPVAPAPLLDHVNRYSLPGAPALKAIGDGGTSSP